MNFLIPSQTFSEYKHREMPVYETLGISATTAIGLGAGAAILGTAGSLGMDAYNLSKTGKGLPSYQGGQYATEAKGYVPTPAQFASAQQAQEQNILGTGYNPSQGFAQQFAQQGTAQQIALQNKVTPGSSAQRELAQQQLNQYIQGQVPLDVQQNAQRAIAQGFGGGYNPFSGGGQAPSAFARDIGQTSLGISQYGLSAAPTWQQLANSMVVSPVTGAQLGMQAAGIGNQQVLGAAGLGMQAAGLGMTSAENQYQAGMNQYGATQAANQGMAQGLAGLGSAGLGIANAGAMANYYDGLGAGTTPANTSSYNPAQGSFNTLMGTGYTSAAATTPFSQQASQIPAAYSGNQSFASGLNPAFNFMQ